MVCRYARAMWLKAGSLVLCSAVNGYLLAVMVLFATVVYPGFAVVDKSAFPAHYTAFNGHIGLPVVAPEFLALVCTLLLYAWRPQSVSLASVHALVVLGVAYFVITFGWHLPAHRALAGGDNSAAAMGPLLSSQWLRTGVQVLRVAVLGWLSTRALMLSP